MLSISDLKEFRAQKRNEEDLLLRLRELKATKENIRSTALHGGGSSGGYSSPVESVIIQIEKLEELYCKRLIERIEKQTEIERGLAELEPIDSMILRAYYISGKTWEQVADSLGYATRSIIRKHKKVIGILAA